MPTHKELLEDLQSEMSYLSESIQENTYSDSHHTITINGEEIADGMKSLGAGVAMGGIATLIGAFVGGYMQLRAQMEKVLLKEFVKLLKEIRGKCEMIKSIERMQENRFVTYELAIERGFAQGSNKKQRRTILNGLISDGIVTEYENGDAIGLEIDADDPDVIAFWERVDAFWEAIEKVKG